MNKKTGLTVPKKSVGPKIGSKKERTAPRLVLKKTGSLRDPYKTGLKMDVKVYICDTCFS